jgi:hypothetical protein
MTRPFSPMIRAIWPLFALTIPAIARGSTGPAALVQGVTTASVTGRLRISDGSPADGVVVAVRNASTGYQIEVEVRRGTFLVQGLEVGGPYLIQARRPGLRPLQRNIGWLSLGEPYRLELVLDPMPVLLDSVSIVEPPLFRSNRHGGTVTAIPDSLIHRLPTLNRNLYDFVRLVPQISTRIGSGFSGISGGGVGFRYNQFLTNGVPERSLSGGQPSEFAGGKSLPFEAVGEYQVLLAPFDVRYGDFAGAAINTVTRSGTNQLRGSGFAQYRSDAFARDVQPYTRGLYGLTMSGPIVRDRIHFFVASEVQRFSAPMAGPYLGQPPSATDPVPVREADLIRLESLMQGFGLTAGSGGAVTNRNPLRNIFARLDAGVPIGRTRAVLWLSDAHTENRAFARAARDLTFALSSQASTTRLATRTEALQLHTALARRGGGHNEFFLSHRLVRLGSVPDVRQPIVTVAVPSATGSGIVTLLTGTPVQAQGGEGLNRNVDVRDNVTISLGPAHTGTLGVEVEWFRLVAGGLQNNYGTWAFLSLDSLAAGLADRFEVVRDFGAGGVALTGAKYGAYAGDQWRLNDRLSLTFGLRADVLQVDGGTPYNRLVDSVFGRRTDQVPAGRAQLSPRAGFTWNPDRGSRTRLRGGMGVFTGPPPLAWFHLPRQEYGLGTGILRCGNTPGSQGAPPSFGPDPLAPPATCAGGVANIPSGDVELLDPRLRMIRTLRTALAWDRLFSAGLVATLEVLLTRNLSDFAFVNLNLDGPQGTDANGRTLYGSFDGMGVARAASRDSTLPGVIELRDVSSNHSAQVSARLEKTWVGGWGGVLGYTWTRVRDVQTPLRVNNRGVVNWSSRMVSGSHEDMSAGISLNDVPHRIVLAGAWRAPWGKWSTEVSVLFVGESGSPFTYRAFGSRNRGDLNADGSNANDPIYVPRNAADPAEIRFSGLATQAGSDNSPAAQAGRIAAQQEAFEQFILGSPCLLRQRGQILARNSCREPWSNTSVFSLRQRIPLGRQGIEAQADLFNLLNLLDRDWGIRRVANPALLEHVGTFTTPAGLPQPVFRFQAVASPWTAIPAESAFQLQVGVTYRF